jgi:hypothetical protein
MFQANYFSEDLVEPGIKPGPLDLQLNLLKIIINNLI